MGRNIFLYPKEYTDVDYVEGLARKDREVQRDFYIYCKQYFNERFRALFFVSDYDKDDIFQETYLTLWENIEHGKIRVLDGRLVGKNDELFKGTLTTYMMAIAINKYREFTRLTKRETSFDDPAKDGEKKPTEPGYTEDLVNDNPELGMLEAISACLAVMSERCRQILTGFYYEEKKLEELLDEFDSFKSKDALKTTKYKCLERLKKSSRDLYNIHQNQ